MTCQHLAWVLETCMGRKWLWPRLDRSVIVATEKLKTNEYLAFANGRNLTRGVKSSEYVLIFLKIAKLLTHSVSCSWTYIFKMLQFYNFWEGHSNAEID